MLYVTTYITQEISHSPLSVDNHVYNMWITMLCLWIISITAPLYVSGCARAVLSFVQSVTLWIAAFRWCGWLDGLAKT